MRKGFNTLWLSVLRLSLSLCTCVGPSSEAMSSLSCFSGLLNLLRLPTGCGNPLPSPPAETPTSVAEREARPDAGNNQISTNATGRAASPRQRNDDKGNEFLIEPPPAESVKILCRLCGLRIYGVVWDSRCGKVHYGCASSEQELKGPKAYMVEVRVWLACALGLRMRPICPRGNETSRPGQDKFGSNMMPSGGILGGCIAINAAMEHQGVGVPHLHGNIGVRGVP